MEYKDYYKILGVAKTATAKEIKSAFRKLARQYHPDVNQDKAGTDSRFKEVNEAYEVLGDADKRKKYDELGSNWQAYEQWERGGGQGAPFDFGGFGGAGGSGRAGSRTLSEEELRNLFGSNLGGAGTGGFSDFFRTFFDLGGSPNHGARGRRAPTPLPQAGSDVDHEAEISLEEAFSGTSRILQLMSSDGAMRRLEVKLPPGVSDGKGIRYTGQGGPGYAGGPAGDLIVRVRIKPHDRYVRDGDDLSLKTTAPFLIMVLGGEVEVPTLAGAKALRVPQGTADGRRFRLTGQGMPRIGREGERGDLFVEIHAELPRTLTSGQRELFEELARLERGDQSTAAD